MDNSLQFHMEYLKLGPWTATEFNDETNATLKLIERIITYLDLITGFFDSNEGHEDYQSVGICLKREMAAMEFPRAAELCARTNS